MVFENLKRKMHGIAFYRVYFKPLGEQTGWSKYGDAYDGMPTSIPQDRFFDIEDPPKNRTYLCVGIKKDGKWAIGSDIPGTWKKKYGEDESAGESKAQLKKRLEKLEKTAGEGKTPSTEEIAGIIILNHINKKIESGDETIWSVVGQMLNPQSSNNNNNNYNPFADTKLEVDGKMPWYMHPAIATTYMQGLPKFAEELSSSFIKGAKKEMAKGELPQQRQQSQQPQQEYVEETEEEPLDIEVRPKSNTIARILAERAAEKEAMEETTAEEEVTEKEEIPSEVEATVERFGAVEKEGAIETVPKQDIKEVTEAEEGIGLQTEAKKTLIERARDRIATKKKIETEEAGTKQDIKEHSDAETEGILNIETEGEGEEGNRAEEVSPTEEDKEIAKREMIRKRTEKAMATRARNKAAKEREKVEAEEIEVEA